MTPTNALGRWVESLRPARGAVDTSRPRASFREEEVREGGEVVPVAAVVLAGKECPWRCVFCDLWKGTTREPTPAGAIPAQVEAGLAACDPSGTARLLKLYNGGSWFDPAAVPPADDAAVALLARRFDRLVVESHPAFAGERALRLRDLLREGGGSTRLEVAMGLESSDPEVLSRLNKGMTADSFVRAARFLVESGIDVRAFVLVGAPFAGAGDEAVRGAVASARFAIEAGAGTVSLIAVRGGNGAMEELRRTGRWSPPRLVDLERALDRCLEPAAESWRRPGTRVLADTWELEAVSSCADCLPPRRARLERLNLGRPAPYLPSCAPSPGCPKCGGES